MTASIVCIGVSDYPKHGLLAGEEKLEFAADSARSLSFLFPRFFSKAQTTLVLNENANIDDVHAVFSEVGKKSELEHFVLYFAGHGRSTGLLLPSKDSSKIMSSEDLAESLSKINARKITLFIDCCHAGAIATTLISIFPSNIEILASTRATDLAWEDKKLQRTIFCAALEQTLPSVPLHEWDNAIKLMNESLRGKVAAAAYGLKVGARQDIQWLKHRQEMQNISIWQVIRKRVFAIGLTAMVVFLGISLVSISSTYRLSIDETGNIGLKHGPKMLSFLAVGPWFENLKTNFYIDAIVDNVVRRALVDESILVSKSSKNKLGLPTWLDILTTATTPEYAEYIHQLMGVYQLPVDITTVNSSTVIANTMMLKPDQALEKSQIDASIERFFSKPLSYCGDSANSFKLYQLGSMQIQKQNLNNRMLALVYFALSSSAVNEQQIIDQIYPYSHETINYGELNNYRLTQFEGHNLFALADAVKLKRLRTTGIDSPIKLNISQHKDITLNEACSHLLNLMKIHLGEHSQFLEIKMWNEIEASEKRAIERSKSNFDRASFERGENIETDKIDPFFGIARLVNMAAINEENATIEYWQLFTKKMLSGLIFEKVIDRKTEEGATQYAKQFVYSRYYKVFTELAKNGKLPKEVNAILFNTLKQYSHQRATDRQFNASIQLLTLLAYQASYLSQEQYNKVASLTENYISVRNARLQSKGPFSSQLAVVRDEDESENTQQDTLQSQPTSQNSRLHFAIDQIWGLLALRGQLKNDTKQTLLKRQNAEFFQEPDYTEQFNLGFNRIPLGSRLVAAARLGLNDQLSNEAQNAISEFLSQIIFNDYFIDPKFHDTFSGALVPNLNDAHMQYNLFSLVLGKHYYQDTLSQDFVARVIERLQHNLNSPRQLICEENIASSWLAIFSTSDQVAVLDNLRQRWQQETEPRLKLSLANVILGSNRIVHLLHSPEAKYLREHKKIKP